MLADAGRRDRGRLRSPKTSSPSLSSFSLSPPNYFLVPDLPSSFFSGPLSVFLFPSLLTPLATLQKWRTPWTLTLVRSSPPSFALVQLLPVRADLLLPHPSRSSGTTSGIKKGRGFSNLGKTLLSLPPSKKNGWASSGSRSTSSRLMETLTFPSSPSFSGLPS